jgi:hypothetical protein
MADVTLRNEFGHEVTVEEVAVPFFRNQGYKPVKQPDQPQSPASTKTKE